jgi:hypothetical protein
VGDAHTLTSEPQGRWVFAAFDPRGGPPYWDPSIVAYAPDPLSGSLTTLSEASSDPIWCRCCASWGRSGGWYWLTASSTNVYGTCGAFPLLAVRGFLFALHGEGVCCFEGPRLAYRGTSELQADHPYVSHGSSYSASPPALTVCSIDMEGRLEVVQTLQGGGGRMAVTLATAVGGTPRL